MAQRAELASAAIIGATTGSREGADIGQRPGQRASRIPFDLLAGQVFGSGGNDVMIPLKIADGGVIASPRGPFLIFGW
ncbi:hypothetical protein [Mesorhizobium sp. CN2-181]|uniref:hypothetical protein n=1 Tax=Mesorhizobium yinganensis TaxID=3157707 RepID=UPI0032B83E2F